MIFHLKESHGLLYKTVTLKKLAQYLLFREQILLGISGQGKVSSTVVK